MRKRIALLLTALMLALTMSFGGAVGAVFAAPANPHPPKEETGPGDPEGALQPGTCTETEQQGANVTTTTHKGSCKSQGGQEETLESKAPPGKNK